MSESDDECTVFEPTPYGARQRLIPSKTFVAKARAAAAARASEAELPEPVAAFETSRFPLQPSSVESRPFVKPPGMTQRPSVPAPFVAHRASELPLVAHPVGFGPLPFVPQSACADASRSFVAQPAAVEAPFPFAMHATGVEPPPMTMQVAMPVMLPAPLAVPFADASSSYVMVPRRRGVRRLAVALLFGSVALVALAGAGAGAVESEPSQGPTIQLGARVYDEPLNAVASRTTAAEPSPPPDEVVVEAAPVAPKATKRAAAPAQRRRAVKVDASTALGSLRPKSW